MEIHDEKEHVEHKVIGLIPSIIVLVALAIVVVWYSYYTANPH